MKLDRAGVMDLAGWENVVNTFPEAVALAAAEPAAASA